MYKWFLYMHIYIKLNHTDLIYMYKEDLALNNQEGLICHKTNQATNQNVTVISMGQIELFKIIRVR